MKNRSLYQILIVLLLMVSLSSCAGIAGQELAIMPDSNSSTSSVQDEQPASPAPLTNTTKTLISEEQTLVDLYERVSPSVVHVQVVINADNSTASSDQSPTLPNLPQLPGFPDLPNLQPFDQGPQQGLGSGFVYDKEGHIITNNHVIADADKITVIFPDNTEVDATLVGADPDSDLAVLQVDVPADQLQPVTLGDSDSLKVGQFLVAIGNPFGLDGSMSTGIVSGLGRQLPSSAQTPTGQSFTIPNIIQTDAAINPGNSGGPLLNLQGEVIGVNTAIATQSGTFSGIGYAVPSATVEQVVPELIRNGRIEHPWLGISGTTLTRSLVEAMNLNADQRGVLVATVVADGPADKAGLHGSDTTTTIDGQDVPIGGDVITKIDNVTVTEFDDLLSYIVDDTKVGQTVTLQVLRDNKPLEITVKLEARPAS
ncbi:MAG: trypsin-like peptidase domain-containing protein [Ardenticatenaceae bacterium]|nr:trypsin-like peptidase domain-containing protein [Ardenticatenaceae bacterium]MCB9444230.1 trypsin-like peptidase domain-containing protein [Ardenticatenaceae bacterium]